MKCPQQCLAKGTLKILVIAICLSGFLYQTINFFLIYWTYPTVVDIQVTAPSFIDMPAFTFCNHLGYVMEEICKFKSSACLNRRLYPFIGLCSYFGEYCEDEMYPEDFQMIAFTRLVQQVEFEPKKHEKLALKLERYLNCSIEYAGKSRPCNLNSTMGSFLSFEDLPQYCFSIYSFWGQPNKKREKIEKGAKMKLHFNLNTTNRLNQTIRRPKFNIPTTAAVQVAVHSPYSIASPFIVGSAIFSGKAYEMQLMQDEKHLLSAPYQTNCTDYMVKWKKQGGKAPTNQMEIVEECKMKTSYEEEGCVPLIIDYPHDYPICRKCGYYNPCNETKQWNSNCTALAEMYNQPCDSISYEVNIEEKVITEMRVLKSYFNVETELSFVSLAFGSISHDHVSLLALALTVKTMGHDCRDSRLWRSECSIIDMEILFTRFEIRNVTYIAKYESLEMFSVVGGYMGMWLGVSLVAVYDFLGTVAIFLKDALRNRKGKRKRDMGPKRKLKKKGPYSDDWKWRYWTSSKDDSRKWHLNRGVSVIKHY